MQKERQAGESFENYKDRLRREKKALRMYCKGRVFWNLYFPYIGRA